MTYFPDLNQEQQGREGSLPESTTPENVEEAESLLADPGQEEGSHGSHASEDFSPFGNDLFGEPLRAVGESPVARKFIVAPFSVFNAREGDWQDRKRAWVGMGIESEVGRAESLAYDLGKYERGAKGAEGTSIFDPVLCELLYRWFTRKGALVVDPFAGGSVRGVIASQLGRQYLGCELRQEQVDANRAQAKKLCLDLPPVYVQGDSMISLDDAPACDFVFSCPPYGDLEVYSDEEADLSNMEWHTFVAAYKRIILKAVKALKPNRFAAFVVADFRDKKTGFYRDFVSTTIRGFVDAGCELYNEAILVTAVGSAGLRVTRQFNSGRKFCKTHQNILVFCKGDWRKAASWLNAETQ